MMASRARGPSTFVAREGQGRLIITNGNSDDAAVILESLKPETADQLVYVRGGMSAAIDGIPTGRYRMMFQLGRTWDHELENFKCAAATGIFNRLAVFEERMKRRGVEYTEISITLHKLRNGNAPPSKLHQSQFRRRRK